MTELRIIMAFILSAMGLFLIWAIISVFFAFFFCTFLYTIGTGFFRWFQRNPLFLNPRKTDRDMSHFVRLPTAFQVYSSLGIKLRNPKFNAQKGINRFQTLLHSLWNCTSKPTKTYLFIFVTGHVSNIMSQRKWGMSQCHAFATSNKYTQIDFCEITRAVSHAKHCDPFLDDDFGIRNTGGNEQRLVTKYSAYLIYEKCWVGMFSAQTWMQEYFSCKHRLNMQYKLSPEKTYR